MIFLCWSSSGSTLISSLKFRSFGDLKLCRPFWLERAWRMPGRWSLFALKLHIFGLNEAILTQLWIVDEVNIAARVRQRRSLPFFCQFTLKLAYFGSQQLYCFILLFLLFHYLFLLDYQFFPCLCLSLHLFHFLPYFPLLLFSPLQLPLHFCQFGSRSPFIGFRISLLPQSRRKHQRSRHRFKRRRQVIIDIVVTSPIRSKRMLLCNASLHSFPLHQLPQQFKLQTLQQSKRTMEKVEESSNPIRRVELAPISKKLPKLNRVCPEDLPQRQMTEENTLSQCPTPHIKIESGSSYLSKQDGPATLGNVLHIRPVYSFGLALKAVEILGDSSPFEVKKIRSFPSNKYELFEKSSAASYDLVSNFFGSQYHLKGQLATYLTIRFQVGCGSSQFRSCTIYALREETAWNQLQGVQTSQDLEQLYSKGNNYQKIAKYATLQPTINPKTGAYSLKFSRKYVVPCVENTIICNFNGQRLLQMAKINQTDSHFEVTLCAKMSTVKVLAIVVASLDFKLCTQ